MKPRTVSTVLFLTAGPLEDYCTDRPDHHLQPSKYWEGMSPRDEIQQAAWDRRRINKEVSAAALHDFTYNIDDWKASTKFAFPRERIAYSNVPESPLPALGRMQPASRGGDSLLPYREVSARAWQSRPQSTMPSSRLRLSLPMQQTAARASKVLNSITPADWSSFTKDGAPEAWQVARRMKGTKKGNLNLRKELAHITHLRDIHRRSAAHSSEPFSSYPATQGLEGGDMGNGGAQRGIVTPVRDVPGSSSGHQIRGSRNGTPANMPPRPATSISNLGEFLPPASQGGTPAMTPNTWKQKHLLELLGTESRPTTVYKVLKRRQPQAQMHMLWSAGILLYFIVALLLNSHHYL